MCPSEHANFICIYINHKTVKMSKNIYQAGNPPCLSAYQCDIYTRATLGRIQISAPLIKKTQQRYTILMDFLAPHCLFFFSTCLDKYVMDVISTDFVSLTEILKMYQQADTLTQLLPLPLGHAIFNRTAEDIFSSLKHSQMTEFMIK